jgi:hypothetical protein
MRLSRLLQLPRRTFQSASFPVHAGNRAVCRVIGIFAALSLAAASALAQPASEAFHWIDFHDAKDAPTVAWVTQSLKAEKWTALREIGVQWDSALVLTSLRATPQSTPPSDTYTVWSVNLAKREVQPLFHGANPRILDWTTFGGASQIVPELGLVYDDCYGCDAPSTFFTTLYYNYTDHAWRARWMRGDQAAALWSAGTVAGVVRTQVYGLLTEPPGRNVLATWSHYDYGPTKPAEDYVYEYSVDPSSGLEQTQRLGDPHAVQMEQRLCKANPGGVDPALAELARGQDSTVCRELVPKDAKGRPMRRPTTTPPANNHGQSLPPPAKK